jgi:hypothetical protein
MDLDRHLDLRALFDQQTGVVSRRQVLEVASPSDLRRWVRRRELVPVHQGVYINHTGPLTWPNRAWAGVLRYWPAALALESATRLAGEPIHLAVGEHRTFRGAVPGIRLHRLTGFDDRIQWNRTPPRQRYEDALLSVCGRSRSREQALELVVEACRSRRTTPSRLREELMSRPNVRDREWLLGVLSDAAEGVQSVLESAYLRKVERAHGLPRAERQVRGGASGKVVWRDSLYRAFAVLVELDGLQWHGGTRRWDDMDRDLDAALDTLLTVRLGWRQAELESCRTAQRLGLLFVRRGWTGSPRPCGARCPIRAGGTVPI